MGCRRWPQWWRMEESRQDGVTPLFSGHFHHHFWVLTGSSQHPCQKGTLYSRQKFLGTYFHAKTINFVSGFKPNRALF